MLPHYTPLTRHTSAALGTVKATSRTHTIKLSTKTTELQGTQLNHHNPRNLTIVKLNMFIRI